MRRATINIQYSLCVCNSGEWTETDILPAANCRRLFPTWEPVCSSKKIYSPINFPKRRIANVASNIQMIMMIAAAAQLTGFSRFISACACSRHSFSTACGIIFLARITPSGINTRSSKYPKMGMGSGIKSIGLKAYPTTQAAKTLARRGTLGSLYAK